MLLLKFRAAMPSAPPLSPQALIGVRDSLANVIFVPESVTEGMGSPAALGEAVFQERASRTHLTGGPRRYIHCPWCLYA